MIDLRPILPACGLCRHRLCGLRLFHGLESRHPWLQRIGVIAGVLGVLAVTLVGAILAVALLVNDFRFAYVAQYTSRSLAWYYALSAFWVGQAGSLLLWAWLVGRAGNRSIVSGRAARRAHWASRRSLS